MPPPHVRVDIDFVVAAGILLGLFRVLISARRYG